MAETRLRLETVSRAFGGSPAVSGVSLEVRAGEVVCLLGPSGCGKSTTLRIAAGVERQDAGRVELDGVTVSDDRRHAAPEARGVGLMFQDFALFPHLTARENVAFGLRGADRFAVADQALARVGLGSVVARYPHELSGGEQQRVALARALAPKPRVMLMDEPFSSLDHRLRDSVRDEALDLLKEDGAAVLLVTHDPEEAMRMADRIALMREGRIVQTGAPFDVYNHPADRRAAAFFSDLNIVHGVVADERAETPFGVFATPGLVDRADVEVIVRPQHLRVDVSEGGPPPVLEAGRAAPARVLRSRFLGAMTLTEIALDDTGLALTSMTPGAWMLERGRRVWASLRRDRCFVFPCAVQSRVGSPYLAVAADGAAASILHDGDAVSAEPDAQVRADAAARAIRFAAE